MGCRSTPRVPLAPATATDPDVLEQARFTFLASSVVIVAAEFPGTNDAGTMESYGTGSVIAQKDNESLVLTVLHLWTMDGQLTQDPKDDPVTVTTSFGDNCPAAVVKVDAENDLVLLAVHCDAGNVIPIAAELPGRGASVIAIGNAENYHSPFMIPAEQGIYLGIGRAPPHEAMEVFGMATYRGMSGGPICYQGTLIGVVDLYDTKFGHLTWSIPLETIQGFVREPLRDWDPR